MDAIIKRFIGLGSSLDLVHDLKDKDLVLSVDFSPDGKFLASGSADGTVKVYELDTGAVSQNLRHHTDWVRAVAFSPDGKWLASSGNDKTVVVYDLASKEVKHTLRHHTDSVWSVAFSPDGRLLASGSWDGTVKICDVATGVVTRTLRHHTDSVYSVAFSPDAKYLASGGADITVKVYDLSSNAVVRDLSYHSDWVGSVVFSPDGNLLASGSGDETVKVYDIASRTVIQDLQQHAGWVLSVAFSPTGKYLATGGDDKTVCIYDLASKTVIHRLRHHTRWVGSVSFSPDGRYLASGSADKTVKIVRTPFAELPPLPPIPDSPVAGRTLATSNFKAAYDRAMAPGDLMTLGGKLSAVIRHHCAARGIPYDDDKGERFFQELRGEMNAEDTPVVAVQRMWTSCQRLCGQEFCAILNGAVRDDHEDCVAPVAALTRAIKELCVMEGRLPQPPFPDDDVCYRGGGFDERYRDFFVPGREFRQPAFLSTSFLKGVADIFIARSSMPVKVKWLIHIHPTRKCVHVNLVTRRVPNLPDEKEYLFAPYSVFTVRSAHWNAGTDDNPHVIELDAAPDNQECSEDLPLAPWS